MQRMRFIKVLKILLGSVIQTFHRQQKMQQRTELSLEKTLIKTAAGDEAHHALPISVIGKSKVYQDAIDAGFEVNTIVNGINLKKYSKSLGLTDGVHANHPFYDDAVNRILKSFSDEFMYLPDYTKSMSKGFVEELSTRMLKELDVLSKQRGIKVDDLFRRGDGMGNLTSEAIYNDVLESFLKKY